MNKILLTLAAITVTCFTACAQKTEKKNMENNPKTLVAYFSATGNTAEVARSIAGATGGTLYEIVPKEAYSSADLDWNDKKSRSSVEMNDPKARPALKEEGVDMVGYDVVFIGFPIWWNEAPRVVNTFIESNDLKGKMIVPFATSGGSGISNSVRTLEKTYPALDWNEGKLLNGASEDAIREWTRSVMLEK